jgi:hypothetical protein
MIAAAEKGKLNVVQWLRGLLPPCPWGAGVLFQAALGGHVDVLEWCRAQHPPCPWGDLGNTIMTSLVWADRLDVLRLLRAVDPPCSWNTSTCRAAVDCGKLSTLSWLLTQDPPCPIDALTIALARHRFSDAELQGLF